MATFTVKEILRTRPWPSADEPQTIYYDFLTEEDQRQINIGRKPNNPLTVGTKLEGTLEKDQRGNGMKFVRAQMGGGGGRPRDPRESARIMRQHSQEMALRYAAIRATQGLLPNEFAFDDLRKIINWFDTDAKAATP